MNHRSGDGVGGTEEKRLVRPSGRFSTRAKQSLSAFAHSKSGLIGVAIIIIFGMMALFAPVIDSNNPITGTNLAAPYAVPAWATIFPQYSHYPPNLQELTDSTFSSPSALSAWSFKEGPGFSYGWQAFPVTGQRALSYIIANKGEGSLSVNFTGTTASTFNLSQTFSYTKYDPPNRFAFSTFVYPSIAKNVTYTVTAYLKTPAGKVYTVGVAQSSPLYSGTWNQIYGDSLSNLLSYNTVASLQGLSKTVFDEHGNYTLTLSIVVSPTEKGTDLRLHVGDMSFFIFGSAYGVLGTDNQGRDIWSQFVHGARVSFLVGILAALVTVAVGVVVGLAAATYGGLVDQLLMRVTDIFLVLPGIPLLIVLISVLDRTPIFANNPGDYIWLVIFVIAILSWPTVARIINSQVLSLKERPYVEAARALGAKKSYIMYRHILPNVLGLIYANLALTVPTAILTEAALDFLGFGSGLITSWGTITSYASQNCAASAAYSYCWWWFAPPGVAIMLLSLSFILLGNTLESIFNPKLRRR
jgi:peptide/nickel transport system permease protein